MIADRASRAARGGAGTRPVHRWNGESIALGLFAGLHTFLFFARQDRFAVLSWWTRETWAYVSLLWIKDLLLGAAAFFAFAEVARLTGRLPLPPGEGRGEGGRVREVLLFLAILAAGVVLRWIAPRQIPPGVWTDALHEAEGALREPGRIPWLGGRPYAAESHALVSNLYLKATELVFRVFGRGDTGIVALSAVGGTLTLPAIYALGREARGRRVGLAAMGIAAFALWPLVYSRWAWVGASLLPLVAGAAALTLASVRKSSALLAFAAGALLGLSLHTHPTAWAVAAGFAAFAALALLRRAVPGRLVAGAVIGTVLAFAPFGVAFLQYPERLGGRPQDVSLMTPVKDPAIPSATGPLAVPARFLYNAVAYTGLSLWTSDPNPRHGLPGKSPVDPLLGLATLAGAAWSFQRARAGNSADRLLVAVALTSLAAGILSNPGAAPNGLRIFPVVGVIVVWAAMALAAWIPAAARALGIRAGFLWLFSLVLIFAAETVPFVRRWPDDPAVAGSFCPEESAAGRIRRDLGDAPTILAQAYGCTIVFETLAAGSDPSRPVPHLPRRAAADLFASPPEAPFWYLARAKDLESLRGAGWRVSRSNREEESGRAVLARVRRVGL